MSARVPRVFRFPRPALRLGAMSCVFFLVMLLFVLGNVAVVYRIVPGFRVTALQVRTLDQMRTASQHVAVIGMRLSDGAYAQTGHLGQQIDRMNRALQALDHGGVLDGREVQPVADPQLRALLPKVHHEWKTLRTRLQAVLLGSYYQDETPAAPARERRESRAMQRQWLADDAQALLNVLDTGARILSDGLHAQRRQAAALGGALLLVDLLALLGMFLWLRSQLLRPIATLRAASARLAQGDYDTHLPVSGSVDFRELAVGFNASIGRIRDLMAKMRSDRAGLERSDTIFRGLASNSIVGIFLVEEGRFSFVSDKMAEIFGYTVQEMTRDVPLTGIVVPRERYLMAEAIKASQMRPDGTLRCERRGRRKNGSVIDIEIFATTLKSEPQRSIIGLVQDVTERKRAESSAQLATIAYENSSEAIAITDAAGVIIDVNPAYSRMTGYWPDEVAGELLPLLRPGRHNRDFYDQMWHDINTQGRWQGEYWLTRRSGESYAQRVVMDTAWNHDGSVNCRVAMLSDITQKKQVETHIWNQAHHDPLTGLPNRQYFNERLQQAVRAADRSGRALALMFLDLDLFKEVNDSMGHAVGDQLLVEVSRRLQDCSCRPDSFVARLGGDEFVLIVTDPPEAAQVDHLCQLILDRVTQPYLLGGQPITISASIGVALYPQDADDAETLMRHVDMAMYVAKEAGRNRYHFFDQALREQARMQRDLLMSLPEAIESGQFFLLYQPIFSLADRRLIQAETLLRWRHPEFGVIAPMDFLPFVEARQLIHPIGEWIFGAVVRQLAHWRKTLHADLRLTVNISPTQFDVNQASLDALFGLMQSHGLPACGLSLEFDERLLMEADVAVRDRLQRLNEAGMRFSISGVSLGLPALLAMRHLPFESLKLERAATEQLLSSEHARVVCEAIVALTHRLGMKVIAEGITSQAQYEFLRAMDCDAGQGYWLGEPVQADAFEALLRASAPPAEGQ